MLIMTTNTQICIQSNRLVEASYRITTMENFLIRYANYQARETQRGLDPMTQCEIDIQDFAKTFEIEDTSNLYRDLKASISNLFDREITIKHNHPQTGEPITTTTRWISSKTYCDGRGYLAVRFAPLVIPFITRLDKDNPYTITDLKQIGKLTSSYAVRFYELAKQYEKIAIRTISISDLREMLNLQTEYTDFRDLKKRVIDPAIRQINQHTDIKIGTKLGTKDELLYEQNRIHRKIDSITIKIRSNKAQPTKQARFNLPQSQKLTPQFIEKNALPGQSWEQASKYCQTLLDRKKHDHS
jgi:plasmid replication initiation protein